MPPGLPSDIAVLASPADAPSYARGFPVLARRVGLARMLAWGLTLSPADPQLLAAGSFAAIALGVKTPRQGFNDYRRLLILAPGTAADRLQILYSPFLIAAPEQPYRLARRLVALTGSVERGDAWLRRLIVLDLERPLEAGTWWDSGPCRISVNFMNLSALQISAGRVEASALSLTRGITVWRSLVEPLGGLVATAAQSASSDDRRNLARRIAGLAEATKDRPVRHARFYLSARIVDDADQFSTIVRRSSSPEAPACPDLFHAELRSPAASEVVRPGQRVGIMGQLPALCAEPLDVVDRQHLADDPEITVVIPTGNRRDDLAATLPSVLAQRGVKAQIIFSVYADRSGTAEFLEPRTSGRDDILVHATDTAWFSRGGAFNVVMDAIRGRFVFFLDCDCRFATEHSLSEIAATMRDAPEDMHAFTYRGMFAMQSEAFRRLGGIPQHVVDQQHAVSAGILARNPGSEDDAMVGLFLARLRRRYTLHGWNRTECISLDRAGLWRNTITAPRPHPFVIHEGEWRSHERHQQILTSLPPSGRPVDPSGIIADAAPYLPWRSRLRRYVMRVR